MSQGHNMKKIKPRNYCTISFSSLTILLLAACSSTPDPHIVGDPNSLLQTRTALLPVCPVSGATAQRESSLAASVAGALIPPLIDTATETIATTLENLANEREEIFDAQTVGKFYQSVAVTPNNSTLSPYEITENPDLGCVVVVHGYFSNRGSADSISEFDPEAARRLRDIFGLVQNPLFYYEASMVYARDRTAFRLKTENFYYSERLMDHKSGAREIELQFNFAKPSATDAGQSFAVGVVDLTLVEGSINLSESPVIGYPRLSDNIQTSFGTGHLPLPSLDKGLSSYVDSAKKRLETQSTLVRDTLLKLVAFDISYDQDLVNTPQALADFLDDDTTQANIRQLLNNESQQIEALNSEISTLNRQLHSELSAAIYALDILTNDPQSETETAQRELERIEERLANEGALGIAERNLATAVARRSELRALLSRGNEIILAQTAIEADSNRLGYIQPITLNVTLTEKRPENKVLKFISSMFSGAQDGITNALKEEFDPAKREELEDAAEEEAQEAIDNQDSVRRKVIEALLDHRAAEVELEALSEDTTALQRITIEKKLALARIDAEIACRNATELSIAPPECSGF